MSLEQPPQQPQPQQPRDEQKRQPQQQSSSNETVVCGQVTYRRPLSSKLVFYDVKSSSTDSAHHHQWWEVVVKAGTYGSAQDVKDLRDSIKLGDEVQVTGWRESQSDDAAAATAAGAAGAAAHNQQHNPALQATRVTITRPWRLHSPDTAFVPQPAPKAAHTREAKSVPQSQQQAYDTGSTNPPLPAATSEAASNVSTAQSSPAAAAAPAPAAAAARVTGPQVSVCKFFVNTGRCAKGSSCPFLHTDAAGGAASRSRWLQQRVADRHQRAADYGFVHNSSAAAKRQRARVLAAWLVQQYGKERLNAGAGVLDVAGGSGSLTFELAHVHGIKCTLVEPRPLKLNKHQHRQLQQAGCAAVISTHTLQDLQAGRVAASSVQHVQQPERRRMRSGAAAPAVMMLQQQQEQEEGEQEEEEAVVHSSPQQQPGNSDASPLQLRQVQAWFGAELWGSPGWQQLFAGRCSLVVGLHPDQACEPILEFATKHHQHQQQLPFVIVPCCVFPRLYLHRRLSQPVGAPVVSYEDLVQYLIEQGGAQKALLDFEGANTVVFRM